MDELKTCPFCGGEAFYSAVFHEERPLYRWYGHVLCKRCQASVGSTGFSQDQEEAKEKAITAWNRRADGKGE